MIDKVTLVMVIVAVIIVDKSRFAASLENLNIKYSSQRKKYDSDKSIINPRASRTVNAAEITSG